MSHATTERNALKHGLDARPELLAPEIAERVSELAEPPWATTADRVALEEVGRLLVLIERPDADLAKRGTGGSRVSAPLLRRARSGAARLAEPTFAERVEIELRRIGEERDAGR